MNRQPCPALLLSTLLAAPALAQGLGHGLLLTFSQPETTMSNSNGTSLRFLQPNEISFLDFTLPCPISAEKWSPRTCFHVQAGDENSNAMYWEPALMGNIDALVGGLAGTPVGGTANPRNIFYSVSTAVGTGVSGAPGLRPGDIGRFARIGTNDGQIEYFLRREQINQALGLPLNTPIDVDAAAFHPSFGVFLSLDQDVAITTPCGPVLLQDGAVFCLPPWTLAFNSNWTIASTVPNSAVVVYTEAQMDAFVANAQVTNRFGACLTQVIDVEALELDWSGTMTTMVPCPGFVLTVPALLFTAESGTGASMLTTDSGGQIWTSPCMPMGRSCGGGGPTLGLQAGIQPTSGTVGAPSYVSGLLQTATLRYPLEARIPVHNSTPSGVPAGATWFDMASPGPLNWVFVTFAPSGVNAVPQSLSGWPNSLLGYPDYYPLPNFYNVFPTIGGHCTFPSFATPPNFPVKLLFQSVTFVGSSIEFSTPAMLDIL